MQHLDEGTIHAWLDHALSDADAKDVEAHVASCPACAALVGEARGLVAAASRIVSALDNVPAAVIPTAAAHEGAVPLAQHRGEPAAGGRRRWSTATVARIAAVIVVAGSGAVLIGRRGFTPHNDVATSTEVARAEPADRAQAPTPPEGLQATPQASPQATPQSPPPARQMPSAIAAAPAAPAGAPAALAKKAPPSDRVADASALNAKTEAEQRDAAAATRQEALAQKSELSVAQAPAARTDSLSREKAKALPASEPTAPSADARPSPATPGAMGGAAVSARGVAPAAQSNMLRRASPAAATGSTLTLVDSATLSDAHGIARRRVYEVRPGVRVVLDAAPSSGDRKAADQPVAVAATDSALRDSALRAGAPVLNVIRWSDSTGTRYTLSGPLSVAELEQLKARVAATP